MKKILATLLTLSFSLVLFSTHSFAASTQKVKKEATSELTEKGTVRIFLVRHGKTMFNTTGQVQGWSDTPLTQQGVDGAIDVAKGLADVPFTKAYSSDLGRAISTANYILEEGNRKGLTLKTLSGIRETNYGGYEGRDNHVMWTPIFEEFGLKFDEKWSQYPELAKHLNDEEIINRIARNDPTGTAETYNDVRVRTKDAIEQIVKETLKAGGGNALAVSHGGEIRAILHIMIPNESHEGSIGNCSVTILTYKDGKYTVESLGDVSYINKGKALRKK